MRCPKCGKANAPASPECESCGVQFKDIRREQPAKGPDLCAYDDHGRGCPSRGIINTTGRWYCRQHWMVLNNYEPKGVGNYVEIPERSRYSLEHDAYYAELRAKRNRRKVMQDDELVPEEA